MAAMSEQTLPSLLIVDDDPNMAKTIGVGITNLGTTWGMHIAADADQVAADRVPINGYNSNNETTVNPPLVWEGLNRS